MDLEAYHKQRLKRAEEKEPQRILCVTCLQPQKTCYCVRIQKFDPKIKFAILIHPLEYRKRIATGRMAHLCLKNSELWTGYDYSYDERVNDLIDDPKRHTVLLYPGQNSVNLSQLKEGERAGLFPKEKELVVFVLDGTWSTAGKGLRRSENLRRLPRICFTPSKPSNFRVRMQPKVECYSTLEAIHQCIELLGESRGFDLQTREQDKLLSVFDYMVEQQLNFIKASRTGALKSRYRKPSRQCR